MAALTREISFLPLEHNFISSRHRVMSPIYSCFEKGCLTKGEKRTRQCRKLLWVMVIFIVVWANLTVFHREEGNGTNTCVRFFSFLVAESSWTSIKQSQTLITHNANRHCRVRFYTFLGQPLSKQLYINPSRVPRRGSVLWSSVLLGVWKRTKGS